MPDNVLSVFLSTQKIMAIPFPSETQKTRDVKVHEKSYSLWVATMRFKSRQPGCSAYSHNHYGILLYSFFFLSLRKTILNPLSSHLYQYNQRKHIKNRLKMWLHILFILLEKVYLGFMALKFLAIVHVIFFSVQQTCMYFLFLKFI